MISAPAESAARSWRALQWLGLVRQCFQAAIHAALPSLGPRRYRADREAAQIAQGQGKEAARA